MEINVNQQCIVTLRERGVEAINKYYSRLGLEPPEKYKVGDKYKGALWDIMHVFGEFTYMGPQPPFDTVVEIEPLN